ncbi:hypothetical protein SNEBB_000449, partial [Seison nebaliae]
SSSNHYFNKDLSSTDYNEIIYEIYSYSGTIITRIRFKNSVSPDTLNWFQLSNVVNVETFGLNSDVKPQYYTNEYKKTLSIDFIQQSVFIVQGKSSQHYVSIVYELCESLLPNLICKGKSLPIIGYQYEANDNYAQLNNGSFIVITGEVHHGLKSD